MKTKQEIMTFLSNEPLLEAEISGAFINWESLTKSEGKTIFFGVGLCTSKAPSEALPFDILSFFFVAEKLRRFFKFSKVIILIADTHALTNVFIDTANANILRKMTETTLIKIIRNFSLPNVEILLASDIHKNQTFITNFDKLPKIDNQYLQQEMGDILWLTKERNLGIKLGWTIDNAMIPSGHDERFFDTQLKMNMDLPISFLFTQAGRTFDTARPKASPYISIAGERRLRLLSNEPVEGKIQEAKDTMPPMVFDGTKRHLTNIVRLFEKLFIRLPHMTLEQKVQFITQGHCIKI